MNQIKRVFFALVACLCGQVWGASGSFQFVEGTVDIVRADGRRDTARKGAELSEGDSVVSGRDAHAQIVMADDTVIAVRPETQLRIEAFRFAGDADPAPQSIIGLLKGTFRTLTGRIARMTRGVAVVRTPNATIGVRGTDHEPAYIPPPAPGETPVAPPGTYDKVNEGAVYIETEAGRIELAANEVGFASLETMAPPVRLPSVPQFLRGDGGLRAGRATAQEREGAEEERGRGARPVQITQAMRDFAARVPLPPAIIAAVKEGDLDPRILAATVPAPAGVAVAGGDLSPGGFLGSGGGVVGAGEDPVAVLLSSGVPVAITSREFAYVRNGSRIVDGGQARTIDGAEVRWGIYAGGSIVDARGSRSPQFFHAMAARDATPLSNLSGTATYSSVLGYTKPVNEAGELGGRIINGRSAVTVDFASARVTGYELSVIDARGHQFDGQYSGNGVPLAQFLGSAGLQLSTKCSQGCNGSGTGNAHGVVVGPRGGGLITSYDIRAGGKGVTGSVVLGR